MKKDNERLHDTIYELKASLSSATSDKESLQRRVQELERELLSVSNRLALQAQESDKLHAEALNKVGVVRELELLVQKLKGDVVSTNLVLINLIAAVLLFYVIIF